MKLDSNRFAILYLRSSSILTYFTKSIGLTSSPVIMSKKVPPNCSSTTYQIFRSVGLFLHLRFFVRVFWIFFRFDLSPISLLLFLLFLFPSADAPILCLVLYSYGVSKFVKPAAHMLPLFVFAHHIVSCTFPPALHQVWLKSLLPTQLRSWNDHLQAYICRIMPSKTYAVAAIL